MYDQLFYVGYLLMLLGCALLAARFCYRAEAACRRAAYSANCAKADRDDARGAASAARLDADRAEKESWLAATFNEVRPDVVAFDVTQPAPGTFAPPRLADLEGDDDDGNFGLREYVGDDDDSDDAYPYPDYGNPVA